MTISTSAFSAFEARVKAWIAAKEAEIKRYVDKFVSEVEKDVEIAFEDLAEIAGAAVLKAAPLVISGQEKFGQAVTDVVQTVEASGKTVAINTAQTAVQQAFDQVQAAAKAMQPAAQN